MNARLRALLRYIAPQVPSSVHLRIIAALADFDAYRLRGHSISLTTSWRKSDEFAFPDGMTEREWVRETQRIWRHARPLPLVLAGDAIAIYALLKATFDR
jgi:hypothetical protein